MGWMIHVDMSESDALWKTLAEGFGYSALDYAHPRLICEALQHLFMHPGFVMSWQLGVFITWLPIE